MKSIDLILSLTNTEFEKFFYEKIFPKLMPIEEERKIVHRNCTIQMAVIIILAIIITVLLITTNCLKERTVETMSFIIMATFVFCGICKMIARKNIKELLGEEIMPLLFSYWGDFHFCKTPIYTESELLKLLDDLTIISRYEKATIDDCIKGQYNDLDFAIVEADVYYEQTTRTKSGRHTRKISSFKGLIFEVEMNKKFKSHTVIKKDRGMLQDKKITDLENVKLEDPEFEKEFEVYSNDQVESRYLLTTSFMERLTKYKRSKRQRIEVAFYNNKAYFFLTFSEDKFEIPINKPITDFAYYRNVLFEFAQILSLADALKLEQKIGL